MRPVGDKDMGRPRPPQMPRRELRHLSRPGDHDSAAIQRSKNLARQFDRGVTHRYCHLADPRFRPYTFGEVERPRYYAIKPSTEGAAILGCGIRRFQLSQNLRLADHHGIEARGDAEEMMNRFAAFMTIEMRSDGIRIDGFLSGKK